MKKRINRALCLLGAASALVGSLLIFWVLQLNATSQLHRTVRETATMLAGVINAGSVDPKAFEENKSNGLRLTWIGQDGTVLYDSAGATENHAGRPEVKAALTSGAGETTRLSDTLSQETYYYALRLSDGSVLRISQTTGSVYGQLLNCVPYVLGIFVVVVALAALLAGPLTRKLMEPVQTLDVEKPMENETYDELTPLLLRIDHQNRQLENQMQTMQQMRDELANIMENMTEGLIVLSKTGNILSMNHSAASMLDCKTEECLGEPLLAACRNESFLKLAGAMRRKETCRVQMNKDGRVIEISLSPALHGGNILLLVDVTEECVAEQMRREFSANVSHELKTPLQTISGSAELLANGMVQEQDKPRFYENILAESSRMNALIGDIIELSKLDEAAGQQLPKERVDLAEVAKDVVESLQQKAQEHKVTIEQKLTCAPVEGTLTLLRELAANLCDNAIIYNQSGGKVEVSTWKEKDTSVLQVKDTGIGIPAQHQSRVFERFYRVDKSHSRASGGTGLGLSIVKHAARLHNADIRLESVPGKGTTITVLFPAIQ